MRKVVLFSAVLLVGMLVGATLTAFAPVKTYQVTGPVLESRPDAVVVKKGTDNWEIARDSSTKVTGDLKVGSKVTIMYRMTATDITVAAAAAAPKKK
jgi:hypothetical protein